MNVGVFLPEKPYCSGSLQHAITVFIMSPRSEQKIRGLCAKVIAVQQDSEEFTSAVKELRAAIRCHLDGLRDQVAELAFVLAAESEPEQ